MEQIRLDLIPNGAMPVCHASQYDDGRVFRINLTENGQAYKLSDETMVLDVRKGDGCAVTAAVAVVSGKTYVDVATTEQMCAVAGINVAELRITKDNAIIGTLNFILLVEPDPLDEGIASSSEIHDLQTQVNADVQNAFNTLGAEGLPYDNTESGLTAENVQDAIDEVNEKIGGVPSDVYSKEETDALLAEKADISTLESDYYTKSEVDTALAGKADAFDLDNYYTKTQTDSQMSGKADKSSVYTKAQTDGLLEDKVDTNTLEEEYYDKSDVNNALSTKADKSNTYTKSEVDTALSSKVSSSTLNNYYTKSETYSKAELDGAISGKADTDDVLGTDVTKAMYHLGFYLDANGGLCQVNSL